MLSVDILQWSFTHYRPASEKKYLTRSFPFSITVKKYHSSGNLKFNFLGIFQSLKLRILMEEVPLISLKRNVTSNTLGVYGFNILLLSVFTQLLSFVIRLLSFVIRLLTLLYGWLSVLSGCYHCCPVNRLQKFPPVITPWSGTLDHETSEYRFQQWVANNRSALGNLSSLLRCVRKHHPKGILSFSLMRAPRVRQR